MIASAATLTPPDATRGTAQEPEYIPAPEEIRVGCLEAQKTWSPEVERKRAAWAHRRVEMLATRFLIDTDHSEAGRGGGMRRRRCAT